MHATRVIDAATIPTGKPDGRPADVLTEYAGNPVVSTRVPTEFYWLDKERLSRSRDPRQPPLAPINSSRSNSKDGSSQSSVAARRESPGRVHTMARLTASERGKLPDRAFASIDSQGRRRLPIHDEAHVRNALSRFERVSFEDDAARERTRKRLLTAAKRYGIVPVGFMTSQLRLERGQKVSDLSSLPTGSVTFLMTDIEGSTALLQQLGKRYSTLITDVRRVIRRCVQSNGGHEVDARADEYFAVFDLSTAPSRRRSPSTTGGANGRGRRVSWCRPAPASTAVDPR